MKVRKNQFFHITWQICHLKPSEPKKIGSKVFELKQLHIIILLSPRDLI